MPTVSVALPAVTAAAPPVAPVQTIVGLPPVTVSAAAARSVVVGLPSVVATAPRRQVSVALSTVTARTAGVSIGQLHQVGGVWRPFKVAHRIGGVWRDLSDGSAV